MKLLAKVSLLLIGAVAAKAVVSTVRNRERGSSSGGKRKSTFNRALIHAFSMVNRRIEWHRLPTAAAILNLIAFRETLREKNLHHTSRTISANPLLQGEPDPNVLTFRTVDGSFNDLGDPGMGAAGARFGRNVPLKYAYPEPEPALLEPSPRIISRRLMTRERFLPVKSLNLLAAAWIQFQAHDWFNHGRDQAGNNLILELEDDDPWHEHPMRIPKTRPDPTRTPDEADLPPTFTNEVSHWWDSSAIYGCDEATASCVRSRIDGKLALQNGRLPLDPETGISITGFNDNWWVGLGLLHTLFTLEHNAICDRLRREYPQWNDDQLYGKARLINAALMAKIHTVEWTTGILSHPALQIGMRTNWWGLASERVFKIFGRLSKNETISGIPGSPMDHHGVPFSLTEEFTSVYRLHPLIPDDLDIHSLGTGELLKKLTFPEVFGRNAETVVDDKVSVTDVFYSFGISHPGAITLHNFPRFLQDITLPDGTRMDLAAVDVLRDRERGVPRYNQFRKLLHMAPATSFEDLTENKQWAEELREIYQDDIDRVDLMVGMYAETLPSGFGFSDTAFRIFILMASRRLKSDRFFTTDYTPQVYTRAGMDWINENGMLNILLRHYPELAPVLRGVKNAFAPWQRVG
jgi:hypothetical protein